MVQRNDLHTDFRLYTGPRNFNFLLGGLPHICRQIELDLALAATAGQCFCFAESAHLNVRLPAVITLTTRQHDVGSMSSDRQPTEVQPVAGLIVPCAWIVNSASKFDLPEAGTRGARRVAQPVSCPAASPSTRPSSETKTGIFAPNSPWPVSSVLVKNRCKSVLAPPAKRVTDVE